MEKKIFIFITPLFIVPFLFIPLSSKAANSLPTLSADASVVQGPAPLAVNFTGFATDTDGFISSYYWDFGDGATSSLRSPSHIYTGAGYYLVIFCVVDDKATSVCLLGDIAVSSASPTPSPSPIPIPGPSPGSGGGGVFLPPVIADVATPKISEVFVREISATSTRITWETDEPAVFRCYYGKTAAHELGEISGKDFATSHSVVLSELFASSTYYFKLKNTDRNGNSIQSVQYTFVTLASGRAPSLNPQSPGFTSDVLVEQISETEKEKQIRQLKARIAEIVALIEQLQAQLQALLARRAASPTIPAGFKFSQTLRYGNRGLEVSYLQIFLKSQGAEIYPEGIVTGFYGSATQQAVIRFQEKYQEEILMPLGFTKGTGVLGQATRTKINNLLGQ